MVFFWGGRWVYVALLFISYNKKDICSKVKKVETGKTRILQEKRCSKRESTKEYLEDSGNMLMRTYDNRDGGARIGSDKGMIIKILSVISLLNLHEVHIL